MNYLDCAATVPYSAGKLIMALSWMPSDTNHTTNTAQRNRTEIKLSTWPQNAPNLIELHSARRRKKTHPQHSEW